jgi:DNA polymerase eta
VDVVAAAADKLWKELADLHNPMKIIGIGLAFAGVEGAESGLKSIDTFFKKPNSKRALEEDVDEAETPESDATTERTTKNISKDSSSFVCVSICGSVREQWESTHHSATVCYGYFRYFREAASFSILQPMSEPKARSKFSCFGMFSKNC